MSYTHNHPGSTRWFSDGDLTLMQWQARVDRICALRWGLDMDSLFGDQATWSNWDAGIEPSDFVDELAQHMGESR